MRQRKVYTYILYIFFYSTCNDNIFSVRFSFAINYNFFLYYSLSIFLSLCPPMYVHSVLYYINVNVPTILVHNLYVHSHRYSLLNHTIMSLGFRATAFPLYVQWCPEMYMMMKYVICDCSSLDDFLSKFFLHILPLLT